MMAQTRHKRNISLQDAAKLRVMIRQGDKGRAISLLGKREWHSVSSLEFEKLAEQDECKCCCKKPLVQVFMCKVDGEASNLSEIGRKRIEILEFMMEEINTLNKKMVSRYASPTIKGPLWRKKVQYLRFISPQRSKLLSKGSSHFAVHVRRILINGMEF